MRNITREACEAFENGRKFSKQNMNVSVSTDGNLVEMYLHGNLIATKKNNVINITLAGWNTNTTRDRLNGLQGVKVSTKKGQAYLNGEKWNGEWITIKR